MQTIERQGMKSQTGRNHRTWQDATRSQDRAISDQMIRAHNAGKHAPQPTRRQRTWCPICQEHDGIEVTLAERVALREFLDLSTDH
jgi:hypothetical protein